MIQSQVRALKDTITLKIAKETQKISCQKEHIEKELSLDSRTRRERNQRRNNENQLSNTTDHKFPSENNNKTH